MTKDELSVAFSALGHPTRLAVVRHLLAAGSDGRPAGELARDLGVRQNTLSVNLGVLTRAKLTCFRREGRVIRYFINHEGLDTIIAFLNEELSAVPLDDLRSLVSIRD